MLVDTRWSAWNEEIEVAGHRSRGAGTRGGTGRCGPVRGGSRLRPPPRRRRDPRGQPGAGLPVQASGRLLALIRSALWAGADDRRCGLAALARDGDPARVPSIHPEPTFADVRITGTPSRPVRGVLGHHRHREGRDRARGGPGGGHLARVRGAGPGRRRRRHGRALPDRGLAGSVGASAARWNSPRGYLRRGAHRDGAGLRPRAVPGPDVAEAARERSR